MYQSMAEIATICETEKITFWECVQREDCVEQAMSPEENFEKMKQMYRAMRAADYAYDPDQMSRSGLSGQDGAKIAAARKEGKLLCGDFIGRVMERAVKMGESNACMKRIVAAPTAGSCGVLPAVLLSLQEEKGYSDDEIRGRCMWPPESAASSLPAPFWRAPPAAVRRRSAPPPPWPPARRRICAAPTL